MIIKIKKFGSGKPILNFIVGIHGNESAPVKGAELIEDEVKKIKLNKSFQIIIANQAALAAKKRFIEVNLNQCFPGKLKGNYEERLARTLFQESQKAHYNIDFHATSFPVKPYGLISNYNQEVKNLIAAVGVTNFIFTDLACLVKYAPNGIGFEVGCEGDEKAVLNCYKLMINILKHLKIITGGQCQKAKKPKIFLIYNSFKKSSFVKINANLVDFKLAKKGEVIGRKKRNQIVKADENFYPIWVNNPTAINKARQIIIK